MTVSLTNWFLKLVTESSCSEWSGQANEGAVFPSISKYSNSSNSNFHSVSLVDILHVLVVNLTVVGLVLTCSSLKFLHTGVRCMCVICIHPFILS